MRRLFKKMGELMEDEGFARFQTDLVHRCYEGLGRGYSVGDNEIALVERLVEAVNGQSYGPMRLSGKMLHGSRSYVEFNYLDKPVTKELADMAVMSVVTDGGSPIFSRICLIQNKKDHGSNWAVDSEQLFLLKNFPPFAGNKGIFRGRSDIHFRNHTGCLGAFGLLGTPGEMILASAPVVSELLRGKQSLSPADICVLGSGVSAGGNTMSAVWSLMSGIHPQEWLWMTDGMNGPLGNLHFARDLYDFIRGWTQMSIGEPTRMYGRVVSQVVDSFSSFLIRSAGLSEHLDLPSDNVFGDSQFHGQVASFLMHIELSEMG